MFILAKLYKNAKQKTPYICSSSQYMYKYVLSLLSTTQGPQYTLVGHWSAVWTHWRRQITVEGFCNQCTKRATSISQFTPHPSFFLKPFKKDGSKVVVYLHGYNPRSPNVTSRVRDDGGYGNHSSKSKRTNRTSMACPTVRT